MSHQRILTIGILIFLLEMAAMIFWFRQAQPESESWSDLFVVLPVLFGINLVIGLVFYFTKRPLGLLFLANAVLCPLLFFAVWIMWFTYWAE